MRTNTHSKNRGGKRIGAGRKFTSSDGVQLKGRLVNLLPHQWEKCAPRGERSKYVCDLISHYKQSENPPIVPIQSLRNLSEDYYTVQIRMIDELWDYCKEQGNASAFIRALIDADMEQKTTKTPA